MEKRGFAVTFKWIFALIAGLIIFLFLINFAYKHIYLSETKTSILLLTNIETQLDSLSTAEDLDTSINIPEQINFNCNSISTGKANIKTNNLIFSNNNIKNTLHVWTRTWKYPFAITNFFYIADENEIFFLFDKPYDLIIPKRFNILTFPDEVPKNAILIFFKQPTSQQLQKYNNHKIKIIKNNKVTFYPDKTTEFYGEEMLLAAIFTDDFNKFKCLKDKALKKLEIITSVYQKKAQTLANIQCTDKYLNIISQLEQFKSNLNQELINNLDKNLEENDCTPLFH